MKTYQYKDIVAHYAKAMSQADAEAKAQRFAAANPDKVEGAPGKAEKKAEKKAEAKPAPKATPKTMPPAKAPSTPAAAKTPEPPKPSPVVAAQVPKVGAKVYGAAPPPAQVPKSDVEYARRQREASEKKEATRQPTREEFEKMSDDDKRVVLLRKAGALVGAGPYVRQVDVPAGPARVPPGTDFSGGRAGYVAREETSRATARPPSVAEAPPVPVPLPPDVPKAARYMERDYSNGGGWQFTEPREVPAMKAALKARMPERAKMIDNLSDEATVAAYKRATQGG